MQKAKAASIIGAVFLFPLEKMRTAYYSVHRTREGRNGFVANGGCPGDAP
jgi:hypothetical protein